MIDLNGRVLQVGAGGVGFWMAAALARAHVDLTVFDTDTLQGGLGWSRVPKASPSTKKTSLLRGFCVAVMGDGAPKIVEERFLGLEASPGDLVVDASDMSLHLRKIVWEVARAHGARVLRVSYDGRNDTVVVAEGLPLSGAPNGGYAAAPSLALSMAAGGIGALAVLRILDGYSEHVEFQISLADYFKEITNVQAASGD